MGFPKVRGIQVYCLVLEDILLAERNRVADFVPRFKRTSQVFWQKQTRNFIEYLLSGKSTRTTKILFSVCLVSFVHTRRLRLQVSSSLQ